MIRQVIRCEAAKARSLRPEGPKMRPVKSKEVINSAQHGQRSGVGLFEIHVFQVFNHVFQTLKCMLYFAFEIHLMRVFCICTLVQILFVIFV